MGFDGEYATPRHLVLDVETSGILDAATYLEPASAPSNYKDPDKIAAYIAEAEAAQLAKAALDPDLARVVAIGIWDSADGELTSRTMSNERSEAHALDSFWRLVTGRTTLIGFGILEFDLRILLRRSLYLGVKAPAIQIDKYRHPTVVDLMQILSFNGSGKWRSLEFYAHRFNLEHDHSISGADIPALVAAGDWAAVESHVRADVSTTVKLARRMGILQPVAESVVA